MHMALKFVLLTLLDREHSTGYEIVKTFDSAVGYFWSASHQQVYRELSKLTENDLVKFTSIRQGDKPDKKVYRLTEAGKKELHNWLHEPAKEPQGKDLLLVKLLNLKPDNVTVLLKELDRDIEKSEERCAVYIGIEKQYYSKTQLTKLELKDLALYLALRKGITGIESRMQWLRQTRAEILKRAKVGS